MDKFFIRKNGIEEPYEIVENTESVSSSSSKRKQREYQTKLSSTWIYPITKGSFIAIVVNLKENSQQ